MKQASLIHSPLTFVISRTFLRSFSSGELTVGMSGAVTLRMTPTLPIFPRVSCLEVRASKWWMWLRSWTSLVRQQQQQQLTDGPSERCWLLQISEWMNGCRPENVERSSEKETKTALIPFKMWSRVRERERDKKIQDASCLSRRKTVSLSEWSGSGAGIF